MAGDWLKIEHSTPDKPEMVEMAGLLEVDHDLVVAKCLRFWIWLDQQSQTGDAISVTGAFIDRLVYLKGFAAALRKVGWLDGRDGRYSVPHFSDHNGQTAKKRAQTQKRQRRYRDAGVTLEASPEKRREEKSTKESKRKEFEPPSVLEVDEYISTRHRANPNWPAATDLTGQTFVDHYDGQGWVTGSGIPIVDWKAKVRAWGNKAPKQKAKAKSGKSPGQKALEEKW